MSARAPPTSSPGGLLHHPVGCVLILIVLLYKLACYVTGAQSGLDERLADPSEAEETTA